MDLSAMGVGDVVQLIGALGLGSAGGWISGGVSAVWKAKHDKIARLEENRRSRIAAWRAELNDPDNREVPTASLPVYQELGYMLDDEVKSMIKDGFRGPFGNIESQTINGVFYKDVRVNNYLLQKVAELERQWGLI